MIIIQEQSSWSSSLCIQDVRCRC